MALLSGYMLWKEEGETLEDYLDQKVFRDAKSSTLKANADEIEGFNRFIEDYKNCLAVEKEAIRNF